jgi:hypothetical protein
MKKLISILLEKKNKDSGELKRIKKLFVQGYKQFLASKARDRRLDFVEDVIDSTLDKSDLGFLIRRLQRKL